MAKVLLVEDDNNLREIYQARLMAEGYDIVAAQNGEEALVVAKQNKPDLVISDVMMPRISGFEMLDILRNTPELQGTKVIMLTALGQAEDQTRANNLGADKYLVKSQVTLEDIVNAAKELLGDATDTGESAAAEPAEPAAAEPAEPAPAPVTETPAPAPTPEPAATAPASVEAPAPEAATDAPAPSAEPTPATEPDAPAPDAAPVAPAVVEPTTPPPAPAVETPPAAVDANAQTLAAEEQALQDQIASYAESPVAPAPAGADPAAPAAVPALTTTDDTDASNTATITEAVNQLNTPSEEPLLQPPSVTNAAPAAPAVIEPAPAPATETPPAASTPEPAPAAAAPVEVPAAPAPEAADNDNVSVSGKKIIQPLGETDAKPDINTLLAQEEAKGTASGTIITPTSPAPNPSNGFDPNHVAL